MYAAAAKILGRPFEGMAPERRKMLLLLVLGIFFFAFPYIPGFDGDTMFDDADVDSMANAASFATLALASPRPSQGRA